MISKLWVPNRSQENLPAEDVHKFFSRLKWIRTTKTDWVQYRMLDVTVEDINLVRFAAVRFNRFEPAGELLCGLALILSELPAIGEFIQKGTSCSSE